MTEVFNPEEFVVQLMGGLDVEDARLVSTVLEQGGASNNRALFAAIFHRLEEEGYVGASNLVAGDELRESLDVDLDLLFHYILYPLLEQFDIEKGEFPSDNTKFLVALMGILPKLRRALSEVL